MTSIGDLYELIMHTVSQEAWEALAFYVLLVAAWFALPIYFLHKALKMARLVMLMRCLPTSKARGVFIGLAEMKGTAERHPVIYSYLAERECAWYRYSIEEQWRRVETQTYRDSRGQVRTRTVVRTGWTTVDKGTSPHDFHIQDDTGSVRVRPQGATVEATGFLSRTCGAGDPMYYGKGPQEAIPHSVYRRRFVEQGIPIGAQLYIIGTTREQEDTIHPEFAQADNKDPYLISIKAEKSITFRKSLLAKVLPPLGIIILLAPSFLEHPPFPYNIYNPALPFADQSLWLHTALIYLAVWLGWTFWQWYSEMVAARHRVSQGAAQVEVQLQRRHDLINRLMDVVDAYCRHEQGLLDRVGELRRQVEEGQLDILSEAYPELKSQSLFSKLHQEFTDTEERLALAREYLNTIGNYYNTCLKVFPGGLILRLMGFRLFTKQGSFH